MQRTAWIQNGRKMCLPSRLGLVFFLRIREIACQMPSYYGFYFLLCYIKDGLGSLVLSAGGLLLLFIVFSGVFS
jgi:hypothetical protein